MNKYYNKLLKLQKKYPKLTFNNKGYEKLDKKIRENYSKEIDKINKILKKTIEGFVEFNNFKIRDDNSIVIRCQYHWDHRFIGVGYFDINLFKNFKEKI